MKKTKRLSLILAFVLTFTACFGIFASAANIEDFTDVPSGAWYTKELNYATEKGLVNGTSETKFSPSDTMSRSQVITILWRAFSGTQFSGTKFTDVPQNQWYTSAIYWGVENGVVNGTSSTTFSPSDDITRQDLATMLGRYIASEGITLEDSADAVSSFKDADMVSSYAKEHVEFMRAKGILKGDTAGNVNPRNPVTRAEGVALLARVVAAINGDDLNDWAVNVEDSETDNENSETTPPDNNDNTDGDIYDQYTPDGILDPPDKIPQACRFYQHYFTEIIGGHQHNDTEDGYLLYRCLDCGTEFKTVSYAGTAYNHQFETKQYVEPTSSTTGSFVCYCECCKFFEKVEYSYDEYNAFKSDYYAIYNNEINYKNAYVWACVRLLKNRSHMIENYALDWNAKSLSSGNFVTYSTEDDFVTAVEAEANQLIAALGSNSKNYYFNFLVKEDNGATAFKVVYDPISPNG